MTNPLGCYFLLLSAVSSHFKLGTSALGLTDGTSVRAHETFFDWLGQLQRVQVLGIDHRLIVTRDLPLIPNWLITAKQFFVGDGQLIYELYQSVRFGSNGFCFSVEDSIALCCYRDVSLIPQAIPLINSGYVWSNSPAWSNSS